MENRIEVAKRNYLSGFNCSQSVIAAYCDYFQLDKKLAFKLSCGFGGGIARTQNICGVISAAIMLTGLNFNRVADDDFEKVNKNFLEKIFKSTKKEKIYNDLSSQRKTFMKSRRFLNAFNDRYGSVNCEGIIKCDINSDEGFERAKENGILTTKCVDCIEFGCKMIEKELFENPFS
jgi:C_GCAxxG_C_C family probable redox protein